MRPTCQRHTGGPLRSSPWAPHIDEYDPCGEPATHETCDLDVAGYPVEVTYCAAHAPSHAEPL